MAMKMQSSGWSGVTGSAAPPARARVMGTGQAALCYLPCVKGWLSMVQSSLSIRGEADPERELE